MNLSFYFVVVDNIISGCWIPKLPLKLSKLGIELFLSLDEQSLPSRSGASGRTDMYQDKSCPLTGCSETYDTLSHVLVCHALQTKIKPDIKYMDVFSSNVQVQKVITTHFARLLQKRKELLESTPDTNTSGPLHRYAKL